MNRMAAIVATAAALMCLSSCALVFHGTNEDVTVTSDPPGATATLSTGETRVTPFAVTVPRKQSLEVHFVKPGYNPTDVTDESQIEAGYLIVDILTLAWPYDAATGAYFAHQQSTIEAKLVPIETGAPGGPARADSQLPQGKVSSSVAGEDTN
jgi:hypothetical protein